MLTLSSDSPQDGDHHREFYRVLKFLFGEKDADVRCKKIARDLELLRNEMRHLSSTLDTTSAYQPKSIKKRIESNLKKVMARTEKVPTSNERDAIIREQVHELKLFPEDLVEASAIGMLAKAIGAPDFIEYWKSSPWLLSVMNDYKMIELLNKSSDALSKNLQIATGDIVKTQLNRQEIKRYREIDPPNARMRQLTRLAMAESMAHRLWITPSLPYFGDRQPTSKFLVFSKWSMVPDSIAGFLSYEAERRNDMGRDHHEYFNPSSSQPLRFNIVDNEPATLRALQLVIPSPTLAKLVDPLMLVRENKRAFANFDSLRQAAWNALSKLGEDLFNQDNETDKKDRNWEWCGVASLDMHQSQFATWLMSDELRNVDETIAWWSHIKKLDEYAQTSSIDANSEVILSHLVDVALGSPATCALRALSRVATKLSSTNSILLTAASKVAMAFRSLFHLPEAQAIVKSGEDEYWRAVLKYSAKHDLQSILDEYVSYSSRCRGPASAC